MIHLITWLPLQYQQILCGALRERYGAEFHAWFAEAEHREFPYKTRPKVDFQTHYLNHDGYRELFKSLRADSDAVVILGGWRSPMSGRVLSIATLLRVPFFIWADHPYPRPRGLLFQLLRKTYLLLIERLTAGFLACGSPTLEHLVLLGVRREKITIFPYWTNVPENWEPTTLLSEGAAQEPLRLIAIGRMVPVKNFDVAIEAISIANKRAGFLVAKLVLAGEGSDRAALEKMVETKACSDCVSFPGWLESDDVYRAIKAADALIVTSAFEPYGVAVLEAMAAGRPVLASEGVIAAIDRNEGTGAILFHPVGDAQTLADQIALLAGDRKRLYEASCAARATAEKWPPGRAVEILNEVIVKTEAGRRMISKRQVSPAASKLAVTNTTSLGA